MLHSEIQQHEIRIWKFIARYIFANGGRSPTIREIARALGIRSTDHVARDLKKLVDAKRIQIIRGISRGIRLLKNPFETATTSLPILGTIHAGDAMMTIEQTLPIEWKEIARAVIGNAANVYLLRVKGDSMIDALVNDGDLVVMQLTPVAENGEMVAAWIKSKQAMTLKRYFREGNWVKLKAENPTIHLPPYPAKDVEVQGKVLCIIRKSNGKVIKPT
ncbi:MAG: repressor LexA [Chloroflexi bacterium]|nr:repressor LexA [Chloroflexota bacterium]